MSRIKRAFSILKEYGLKTFILRSVSNQYQSFYLLKKDLTETLNKNSFIYCKFITEELLEEMIYQQKDFLSPKKINVLRERLKRPSTQGIIYQKDGKIHGMQWVDTKYLVEFQNLEEALSEHTIYLYDVLVFPEYRRKGINNIISDFTFSYYSKDYKRALSFVSTYNAPMLSQMKKLNFKIIGIYRNYKLLHKKQMKEYSYEKEIR